MLRATNTREIERRGGVVGGDDDFEIVACTRCGCTYLYNAETLLLYFDPDDLSRRYLNATDTDIPACRSCERNDWDFLELHASAESETTAGPWSWAL